MLIQNIEISNSLWDPPVFSLNFPRVLILGQVKLPPSLFSYTYGYIFTEATKFLWSETWLQLSGISLSIWDIFPGIESELPPLTGAENGQISRRLFVKIYLRRRLPS